MQRRQEIRSLLRNIYALSYKDSGTGFDQQCEVQAFSDPHPLPPLVMTCKHFNDHPLPL